MASLSLSGVRKSFGTVEAVQPVDIEIADGEFLVLVGPSGCGKSTLLRMIAGLENLSGGEIRLDGVVMNNVAPRDRDMAMVFQDYALYPHMSVADNLGFALKMQGEKPEQITLRVNRAAEILELGSLLDRKPRALSGGQRQRVALGRALVREPKLFLFDEPLSNLDAKLRVGMRMEIKKLQTALKTTSVYVTHDQVEAMTMADRIVVLQRGVIQQIGTPKEIYARPANLFVGTFIGSPPMSLVPCCLEHHGQAAAARLRDGTIVPLASRSFNLASGASIPATLGIRAEHVKLSDVSQTGHVFTSDVSLVEDHGADSMAMISLAGSPAIARIPPDSASTGDVSRSFTLDTLRIHVFDGDSGAALA